MARLTNKKVRAYNKGYYLKNRTEVLIKKKENIDANRRSMKEAEKARYALNMYQKRAYERARYTLNSAKKRDYGRVRYASNGSKKREYERERYASNTSKKREYERERYASNASKKREYERAKYISNSYEKKTAAKMWYRSHAHTKKASERNKYYKFHSTVLLKRQQRYYGSLACQRAAKVLRCAREYMKQRAKCTSTYELINNKYSLHEPKQGIKQLHVKKMKNRITSNTSLRRKVISAFRNNCKHLGKKVITSKQHVCNAVLNIAAHRALSQALKYRKKIVREFLTCVRSANVLSMSSDNLGECYHTTSSEPYFYDQSYTLVNHDFPIPIDNSGRCVIAEEVGERNSRTDRPMKWRCTSECKSITPEEKKSIIDLKTLFQQHVHKLRHGLDSVDCGCQHGHYAVALEPLGIRDLAGHPMPCTNSGCSSSLRILRAAAPHYPVLRRFMHLLYEAIRHHKMLHSIDTALCVGDFEKLCFLCQISNYKKFFSASISTVRDQPFTLQQPKLPNLESNLHIKNAEIIAKFEVKIASDAEFSCCSCERLMHRKQVTAFKLTAAKYSSQIWKTLKTYIADRNSDAAVETHYVCQYCRPILNRNEMPCRCVLNGMETDAVPEELKNLNPLSKQLLQKAKSFQAVYKLGTYLGNVPSYNSLKACRGLMFFLPLPLEKTKQTLEEVENKPSRLPNPELYIIVNSSPTKKNIIWQSLINVDKVKAALRKLKEINWLYKDVDVNSLDDTSKLVIESVSNCSSTMLKKVSADDVASYQSYTIRRLDRLHLNMSDTDQYQLMNVKEDALSNKFKYLDVLCFPTLFPSGRFGESHPRQVHISLSEFAKSRLLNKDGRFRKDDHYIFYLLWQKEMREISAGVYNVLKTTRQCAIPVGEFMQRLSNTDQEIESNLSTVFQSVRGSKQYWFLRNSDVKCMIREYGSPTLFLTLSCAEYDSLDISTYLRKVNDVCQSYPIQKLCTEDPVSVSRKFSQKFHDFLEIVILRGQALGPVAHYFYKKEYQARGAPHYHILLWIEGAPVAGKDDDDVVLQWIQERITCRIPEEQSNPELHQLVTKYQYHKCSNYCRRRKRVKSTFITHCRFGFPRPPCESAALLSVDECMKLSHRKMYKLPRSPDEIRINNYNPLLLMLWKANMDLQFIAESSLAIAYYVTGYVTKAERSNMQDLWQEVSSHATVYSKLWSFGVRSLRSRECGLYEASDLLLGDHLCGKSVTIKWVDVSQPQNRKRRLINHSRLVEMRETNPNSTVIFEDNVIDTFYPQRPGSMKDICLYDFVANYTKCGVDKDGKAVYRKLNKTILPNHRIYNPSKENERESYFYSLLLLFVPFHKEEDLIKENEDAEHAFNRHMQENDALDIHSKKLLRMLEARETVQKINEARQAEEERVPEPEPVDEGPQIVGEATSAMHDVLDLQPNDEKGPSLQQLVSSLNADQARIFDQVKRHLEHQAHHENDMCKCSHLRPLHMFVSGVGGTGKSFLIKTIHSLVLQIWHGKTNSLLCAVTAPTGLAAFNIGGVTIHRLLQLPIEHEGKAAGYWRLGKEALKVMRNSLSQLRLLIIDEVSMVSNLNLTYIHLRLEEIFGKQDWFGGINVLFVGDILQLPPVNGAPVFDRMTNKAVASKLGCMTSINIWQDTVIYDELIINERQKDPVFISMLDEVRRGCPSQKTIQALQTRVIITSAVDKFEELLASKQSPLCLFPTRQSCHEFNLKMLSRLESNIKDIPCTDEVDETTSIFKWSKRATEEMKKLNKDCNLTAGLEAVLQVAVGARVMLRRNIDTSVGLVNGALGTVISIKAHHIIVKFDNIPEPYEVAKVKSRFMIMKKIYIHRMQFPLILAFAITIHKCQGLTLDCAIMDLSDEVFCAGMAYVALSRVKQLENLHLIAFQPQSVKANTKCLQEINRLRQIYRPDLSKYVLQSDTASLPKRKRKLTGNVVSNPPDSKRQKMHVIKRKIDTNDTVNPSHSKQQKVNLGQNNTKLGIKPEKVKTLDKKRTATAKESSSVDLVCLSSPQPGVPRWRQICRYNPLTPERQQQVCQQLGLRFVCANKCSAGGPGIALNYPTSVHHIRGDGNCLFRALSYVITGTERQHLRLRHAIVRHLRSTDECRSLLGGYIRELTIEDYIQNSQIENNGVWGSQNEMLALAHMAGVNIFSFNEIDRHYHIHSPGVIDYNAYPEDYTRPSIYLKYTGNHFNVVVSQE